MAITVTLDKTGRVLLPSEIRRQLNLRPGTRLELELMAERIELTPQPEGEPTIVTASSRRRVLPPTGKPFDAAAATRDERAAQSRRRPRR